jgi:hypothetical protein
MWLRSTIPVLALILLDAGSTLAQQNDCRQRSIPVSVFTHDGTPPPNLSAASFHGTVNGKQVQINAIAADAQPGRIILLLDASGSVRGGDASNWKFTLDLADDLLVYVPTTTEVGLAVFSEQVETTIAPTTDRKMVADAIETLRSSGKGLTKRIGRQTALWDAVNASANMLGAPQLADTIYVITDAGDNESKTKVANVAKTLSTGGIRLFSFTFTPAMLQSGPLGINRITETTGGWMLAFPPPRMWNVLLRSHAGTELRMVLDLLYRPLLNFRRLDIELPESPLKPENWKLELIGLGKSTTKNLVLIYPQQLMPCN